MAVELLRFPHKQLRASVIKDYMRECGYSRAVCFTCGNAATALLSAGIDTLHIGEKGVLSPLKWFTQAEIQNAFPSYFDATSGHLPISLMQRVGERFKAHLGELPDTVYVPSGSGETLVCLKLVYPATNFVAVYNLDKATEYSEYAPLNRLVELLACRVVFADKEIGDWQTIDQYRP